MTLQNTKTLKKQIAPFEKSSTKKVYGRSSTQSCHLWHYGTWPI